MKQSFRELVESAYVEKLEALSEDNLEEGKVGDFARKLKNATKDATSGLVHNAKQVGSALAYHATRDLHLKPLSTSSSVAQLNAAHDHMTNWSGDHNTAAIIAKHPKASGEQLGNAIHRSGYTDDVGKGYRGFNKNSRNQVIHDAIRHPNANKETLLSATRNAGPRLEHGDLMHIINHPKADAHVIENAFHDAKHQNNTEAMAAIAKHPHASSKILGRIAQTTKDANTLHSIASHSNADRGVAFDVARNKHVGFDSLNKMHEKHKDVGALNAAIVSHPKARGDDIDRVIKHAPDGSVPIHSAMANRHTSEGAIHHIVTQAAQSGIPKYRVDEVNDMALKHNNTGANTLRHIYDNSYNQRKAATEHPNGHGLRNFGLPQA